MVVLASLGVPLADTEPLPRVTDRKGVLAIVVLYVCIVVFTVSAVVA